MAKITVQNTPITVLNIEEQDYISLTDMATAKDGDSRAADVIKNFGISKNNITRHKVILCNEATGDVAS